MTDIAELEQRIIRALDRIGSGVENLQQAGSSDGGSALEEALEAEKVVTSQLEERVKALHTQYDSKVKELQGEIEALRGRATDVTNQVQQLRRVNQHLSASLQHMREAMAKDLAEPHLVNQAMMSELDGLRSVRDADRAELDDILGALEPLLKEA